MNVPREKIAIGLVADRLAEIFGSSELSANTGAGGRGLHEQGWDEVVEAYGLTFAVEWKRSGGLGIVAHSIRRMETARLRLPPGVIPLLAVPYMGDAAREHCEQSDVPWLDLSGNARIVVPGVFYQNLGNANRFKRAGRPETAFGPRGSRIARRLLLDAGRTVRQKDLASGTGLDAGHTSRVVGKLLEDGLVERARNGVRAVDADALLDAWLEDYRFDRHQIVLGHIAARAGDVLVRAVSEDLSRMGIPYAATALPAAWLWTRYAGFRIATIYLSVPPTEKLKEEIGFREADRGSNIWLVVPNDDGVFDGAEFVDGIRCVHPVQTYVDLKNHPERAAEAAAELRRRFPWKGGDDR